MTNRSRLALAAVVLAGSIPAGADTIDFESPGLNVGDAVGIIVTGTNTVTFSVAGGADGYVHAYGPPQTAFGPGNTVAASTGFTTGGDQFLSDEAVAEDGLVNNLPYQISFLSPITSLSLDLLDFRSDGGSSIGDNIVVTAWANDDFTGLVWTTSIGISGGLPDASWQHISTLAGIGQFRSFTIDVSGGGDVGTGIDNVSFTTAAVPEPGSLALLGGGLVALRAAVRRRREARLR